MQGWINLYKPRGISSAKVVAIVKRNATGGKVGHTGTLDVEAEGVLPIAVGQATKLVSVLMDAKKEYVFRIKFGKATDTGDASGKVTAETNNIPTKEQCQSVIPDFLGQIEQVPPNYSAIKVDGVRAYKLARKDKDFSIPKRAITIYELKLLDYAASSGEATYKALCSKGTYIRTLAEDISLSLQSLGFVVELRRTKVGVFTEKDSVDISEFVHKNWQDAGSLLLANCQKLERVLDDIPVFELGVSEAVDVRNGKKILPDSLVEEYLNLTEDDLIWLRFDNKIVAIGSIINQVFKASRVFNP